MSLFAPRAGASNLRNPKTDRGKRNGRIVNVPLDGAMAQRVRRGFNSKNEFVVSKPGDTK